MCIYIIGKGPLKADFEANVLDMATKGLLKNVAVKTAWLSPKVLIYIYVFIFINKSIHRYMSINTCIYLYAYICIYIYRKMWP
jgi:hypothetical protein